MLISQFAASEGAEVQVVGANREVILSAGAVGSPRILQLSGIGPASLLEKLDIPVLVDLPGVGSNYQDHAYLMAFSICTYA